MRGLVRVTPQRRAVDSKGAHVQTMPIIIIAYSLSLSGPTSIFAPLVDEEGSSF